MADVVGDICRLGVIALADLLRGSVFGERALVVGFHIVIPFAAEQPEETPAWVPGGVVVGRRRAKALFLFAVAA